MNMPPNSSIAHISKVALHTPELFYHYFFVSAANRPASTETRFLLKMIREVADRQSILSQIKEKLEGNNAYSPTVKCLLNQKDQCTTSHFGQYDYSICILGEAKQGSVRLGTWKIDSTRDYAANRTVEYIGGQSCWNGIERRLVVDFECGEKEEIVNVVEPSTCRYKAVMKSPCFCTDDVVETIRNKMN